MAARLQQFVQDTKNKKDEEAQRLKEVRQRALTMVPRCQLNEDLSAEASPEDLWEAIHANFEWSFGPAKGKSLKDTKTQFIKWAMRKLKEPVRTICQIELIIRGKQFIDYSDEQECSDEQGCQDPAQQPQTEIP